MAIHYTTYAKVILLCDTKSIQYLTDDAEAGSYASTVVNECIVWAGNKIDGYCAAKYSVPFAAVTDTPDTPEMIQDLATELTIFRIQARRGFRVPPMMWENYQLNIRTLEQLAKGVITIPDATISRGTAENQILGAAVTSSDDLDFGGFTGYGGG